MSIEAFTLGGPTVSIAATTATANVAYIPSFGRVRIVNATTGLIYVKSGIGVGTVAATTDTPMLPSAVETFSVPANHTYIAVIAAVAGNVFFTVGDGI